VLVVDTSLMNVSIAKVVEDLGTTVSGVQGAIALEALVSAAFILIGSKVGDLIGRKQAFVIGLLAYAPGALAMAFSQGLTAIIVFCPSSRAGRVALAAGHAVADPWQLPRCRPKAGVRARRRRGGDRRHRRAAGRRLSDHLPVVAGRGSCSGVRDRGGPERAEAHP
jgi:hypothetical protein